MQSLGLSPIVHEQQAFCGGQRLDDHTNALRYCGDHVLRHSSLSLQRRTRPSWRLALRGKFWLRAAPWGDRRAVVCQVHAAVRLHIRHMSQAIRPLTCLARKEATR